MNPGLIVTLIVGLIGPVVAYVVAVRKLSGRVGTSEAGQLWSEARNIRDDYRSRIDELNGVIARCEDRIQKLEERNDELYMENGRLGRMIEEHEATIAELRSQVHRLADENDDLRGENTKLRVRLTELEATS